MVQALQRQKKRLEPRVASTKRGRGRPLGPVANDELPDGVKRFIALRMRYGSQGRLAKALTAKGSETSQRNVGHWESGVTKPSEARLVLLAHILKAPIETIESCFFSPRGSK